MKPLSRTAMELASGGEIPLVILGAAAGAAHYFGQALGKGELSLESLAVSAVAGMAISRALSDTDVTHIMNQDIFTTITTAGMYGYLASVVMRLTSDKEYRQLTDFVS